MVISRKISLELCDPGPDAWLGRPMKVPLMVLGLNLRLLFMSLSFVEGPAGSDLGHGEKPVVLSQGRFHCVANSLPSFFVFC